MNVWCYIVPCRYGLTLKLIHFQFGLRLIHFLNQIKQLTWIVLPDGILYNEYYHVIMI